MAQSKEYQSLLQEMHNTNKKWGKEFKKKPLPQMLVEAIEKYNPKTIMDFGCGKGTLGNQLKNLYPEVDIINWDPAHGTDLPENVDMIISTDVLEHVEPEYLEETLEDLANRANICQYHLIACFPAVAILPDGRNAHLIIENPQWWKRKLETMKYKIIKDNVISYSKRKKDKNILKITKYECILER